MKKILLVFLSVLSVFFIAGCGGETTTTASPTNVSHTVSFMNGEDLLKEVTVSHNEMVSIPTDVNVDGYTFTGWFATPTLGFDFPFDKPITKDTKVFGGFVSYSEDIRDFYIVGAGATPLLSESNWGDVITDSHKLVKSDEKNINNYEITIDLAVGDEFAFVINTDWHNQRGFGYVKDASLDDEVYFQSAGGLGTTETKRLNIKTLIEGNYTFTLTTYPNKDYYDTKDSDYSDALKESFNLNDFDSITWKRNGDSSLEEITYDYYYKSDYLTGNNNLFEDKYKMIENDGVYTLTTQLVKGEMGIFYTADQDFNIGTTYLRSSDVLDVEKSTENIIIGGPNYIAKENGTYTFVYNKAGNSIVVSYDDEFGVYEVENEWLIVGNGLSPLLKESNWGAVANDHHYLQQTDELGLEYEITLDLLVGDRFEICCNQEWGRPHGSRTIDLGDNFSADNNITVLIDGNYTFTLTLNDTDPTQDKITWVRNGDVEVEVPEIFDVYIKGTMTDWATELVGSTNEGTVKFEYAFAEGDEFGFSYFVTGETEGYGTWIGKDTILASSSELNSFDLEGHNAKCVTAGTYFVTIEIKDGVITVSIDSFDVYIKGTMTGWATEMVGTTKNGDVEFSYTFEEDDEFGIVYFITGETEGYGNWVGKDAILASSSKLDSFNLTGGNAKCVTAGTYSLTVSFTSGIPTILIDATN